MNLLIGKDNIETMCLFRFVERKYIGQWNWYQKVFWCVSFLIY